MRSAARDVAAGLRGARLIPGFPKARFAGGSALSDNGSAMTAAEIVYVGSGSILFSNSGFGCQALHNVFAGPTVLSAVGGMPRLAPFASHASDPEGLRPLPRH